MGAVNATPSQVTRFSREQQAFDALLRQRGVDAERVLSGLFIGSQPPEGDLLRQLGFRVLVLCAAEYQPQDLAAAFPGLVVIPCPIEDRDPEGTLPPSTEVLTDEMWSRVAGAAAHAARLRKLGARTLVTCRAGRNRSGIVTTAILHVLTGAPGSTCLAHVRASRTRAPALTNNSFAAALESLPAKTQGR